MVKMSRVVFEDRMFRRPMCCWIQVVGRRVESCVLHTMKDLLSARCVGAICAGVGAKCARAKGKMRVFGVICEKKWKNVWRCHFYFVPLHRELMGSPLWYVI